MEERICALCGEKKGLVWMGGMTICAGCTPDVQDELNRLLTAGEQTSVARIVRDMRRRKEGIKPDMTRSQLEALRQYMDCPNTDEGWQKVLSAFGF